MAKITIVNFVEFQVLFVAGILLHIVSILDSETLALAIECVNLLLIRVVERLVWEVLPGSIHIDVVHFREDGVLFNRVNEMIVGHSDIMEEIYEDLVVVVDKATRDERIGKTCDRNRMAVEWFVFLSFFYFRIIE